MKRTLGVLLLTTVALTSCGDDPEPTPPPPPPEATTVADVLAAEGFNTLAGALETAGLTETLSGAGPFTLFAPTDDAFAELPEGSLDDAEAVADLLRYHVLGEKVNASDFKSDFYTTLQESLLAVTLEGESADVTLNSLSTVTEADIAADNGVVHGIDTVLTLPEDRFAAPLAGANEVPPVKSDATGQVTATLAGTTLTISGTFSGLSVADPGAHIHGPADVEATADVLFPLEFSNETGEIYTTIDLAAPENEFGPAAFGHLQNGFLYANLHTEEHPSGEIRGQLLPTDDVPATNPDFTAILSGDEEVPEVTTDGTGTAEATLDDEETTLTLTGTYADLSGAAVAGHIHEAAYDENGPVVVPLTLIPDETDPTSGTFNATVSLGAGERNLDAATLADNGYYLNLHTEENPSGEIRGQLTATPEADPPVETPTSR